MITHWQLEAACVDTDPEYFFDDAELSYRDDEIAKIVDKLCASCKVRKECFNYGVQTKSYGVWGGFYLKNGRRQDRQSLGKDEL